MQRTAKVIQLHPQPTGRPFGSLRQRRSKLYAEFQYLGHRQEVPLGIAATPENERAARGLLERLGAALRAGQSVDLAEVFPNASDTFKDRWAALTGRPAQRSPEHVTLGEYVAGWVETTLAGAPSDWKQRDYTSSLKSRILPAFGAYPFSEITGVELVQFVQGLVGEGLSTSRVRNLLVPLRIVWEDACEQYGWDLRDPFRHLARRNRGGRIVANREKNPPEVFRFDEWQRVLDAVTDHYRPQLEVLARTGLIGSELARVTADDLTTDALRVRGKKTQYRARELPLTKNLRPWLDRLIERGARLHTGAPIDPSRWRQEAWVPTLKRAGVTYRRPYSTRHTYAAWSLMVGVNPDRLVRLMGHSSRQMVYDVYGKYVDGLEADTAAIRRYLGPDHR